ncbi:MAG: KaiB protein [Verrucomicrobiales bacterium]|nr:KaiB protein [Verrucomicrobiales bacterium]
MEEKPEGVFTLFVAGGSSRSRTAIASLRQICAEHFPNDCDLTIVDVLKEPELAEEKNVLATPTLIREKPLPSVRLIGDLSDKVRLLAYLNLPSHQASEAKSQS